MRIIKSNMLKIRPPKIIIKSDWNEAKHSFSFEIFDIPQSLNDLKTKVYVEGDEDKIREICHDLPREDIKKILECWCERVKALWLSLDEEFIFSKEIHEHKDYAGMSDFERLSQKSNDGNYPL